MLSSLARSSRFVQSVRRMPMINQTTVQSRSLHTHFTAAEREEQDDMVLSDHTDLFTNKSQFLKFVNQTNNKKQPSNSQNDQVKAEDYDGNDTTQSVMEAAGLHTHRLVAAEMVHHH
jgi:hypothetical protein